MNEVSYEEQRMEDDVEGGVEDDVDGDVGGGAEGGACGRWSTLFTWMWMCCFALINVVKMFRKRVCSSCLGVDHQRFSSRPHS